MNRQEVEKILDNTFGMFLQDKKNPIYKNIRTKATQQILDLELSEEEKFYEDVMFLCAYLRMKLPKWDRQAKVGLVYEKAKAIKEAINETEIG